MSTAEKQVEKVNFMDVLVRGISKGMQVVIKSVFPSVIFSFFVTRVLTLSGLMDLIGTIFTPIMFLFGLPGESAVPLSLSILSPSGGVAATVALIQDGTLTGVQGATMIPFMFLAGALLLYTGRILSMTGVKSKHYKYIYGICFLNAVLSLWVTQFVLSFML